MPRFWNSTEKHYNITAHGLVKNTIHSMNQSNYEAQLRKKQQENKHANVLWHQFLRSSKIKYI